MDSVIAEAKHLTGDLGGKASTTEMGDAVVEAVRKAGAKFRIRERGCLPGLFPGNGISKLIGLDFRIAGLSLAQ